MAPYIVSGRGDFVPAPEGLFAAVCVDVVDLGIVSTQWGDKAKVALVWEIDSPMEDGRRFTVRKRYSPSLHPKAELYKDLVKWRGREFTADELRGFDLERLIGAPCKVVITHTERDGTVYGNVTALMKADTNAKLLPSGEYVRVKDRPTQSNSGGNGGTHAPTGEEDAGDTPPF